jgi:ribonuclease BN (tRNA processing enzyme)
MADLELVVLGSGGWVPQATRMTTCLALRTRDVLVLFDAGTGLARLLEPRMRRLIPEKGDIHVLLSHLHLDHTAGLSFLPALWWHNPTTLHVPVLPGAARGPGEVLDGLIGPPFFPHRLSGFPQPMAIVPLEPGGLVLGGHGVTLNVQVRAQTHSGGSMGFRVDDALAFLTDTVYDPESARFARGVGVLVHEAWSRGEDDPPALAAGLSSHTSAMDAARVARDAGAGELLLSHLSPLADEDYYAGMLEAARSIFPQTALCEDGLARFL